MADKDVDEKFGGLKPHVGDKGNNHEDIEGQEIVVSDTVSAVLTETTYLHSPKIAEQKEEQQTILRPNGDSTGERHVSRAIGIFSLTDKQMVPQGVDVLFIIFGFHLSNIMVEEIVVFTTQ